jgi:alpha,alpha-trehalase
MHPWPPRVPCPRALLGAAFVGVLSVAAAAQEADALSPSRLRPVREYVKQGWTTLTRSVRDLIAAAPDPKMRRKPGEAWPVYLSAKEDRARVEAELRAALGAEFGRIDLRTLPADRGSIKDHGLLYLPRPYVVPGGRFNEMYGWDSYFIQVGLLRDGELERAKDMVENFLYEIEHYGTILNANRTYFLSRSQPPFLTEMILGAYARTNDREWLARTVPAIEKYYALWTTGQHLAGDTRLSRYWDFGEGPAPEVVSDERDAQGRTHYDRAREFYRTHRVDDYDVGRYYDRKRDRLTDLFYKGDRSMRESGFDPSNRFGTLNVDVIHYAPVCLNALLFRMEIEAGWINEELGNAVAARAWQARAEDRREAIDRHLWDEKAGMYFDYNFETKQRRPYEFATTFWPLWVGAASKEQARRVHDNLSKLEAPGGILTSARVTGNQWDAPFGWAPLQLLAVDGLRRYGYDASADRLARKFLSLVVKEFEEHSVIVEKYDVQRRESDVASGIRFGYASNEIGFGWTNAAFVEMLAGLEGAEGAAATALSSVALPPALDRLLRDYERAWQARDPAALAELFAEEGFVLASGRPPVRGRSAIRAAYSDGGGPLALRALAYATEGPVGYIIGMYGARAGEDTGKFVLALRRGDDGRWLIAADIDNSNRRPRPPAPPSSSPPSP